MHLTSALFLSRNFHRDLAPVYTTYWQRWEKYSTSGEDGTVRDICVNLSTQSFVECHGMPVNVPVNVPPSFTNHLCFYWIEAFRAVASRSYLSRDSAALETKIWERFAVAVHLDQDLEATNEDCDKFRDSNLEIIRDSCVQAFAGCYHERGDVFKMPVGAFGDDAAMEVDALDEAAMDVDAPEPPPPSVRPPPAVPASYPDARKAPSSRGPRHSASRKRKASAPLDGSPVARHRN